MPLLPESEKIKDVHALNKTAKGIFLNIFLNKIRIIKELTTCLEN